MCVKKVLILGERDNVHDRIKEICDQYSEAHLLSYSQSGGTLIPNDLESISTIILSMLAPWEVREVLREARKIPIPVIGLHTFADDRVREKYLSMGMAEYTSIFEFLNIYEFLIENVCANKC